MHTFLPVSLPLCLPVLTGLHSHLLLLLLYREPPLFFPPQPATSSAAGDVRDPASKAPTPLSDRPQSQSLPLSGAEVYTYGKLIPMPCLPHTALMSKAVRRAETGVTVFRKTDAPWEAITLGNNERKRWRAAGLMKVQIWRKKEKEAGLNRQANEG